MKQAQKKPVEAPKSNWRAKHEDFMNTVKAARGVSKAIAEGGPLPPPPPPSINPDYIQCPYCSRRFSPTAADRHISFCKEQSQRVNNRPLPNATAKAKQDVRTQPPTPPQKYQAPKPKAKTGSGAGSSGTGSTSMTPPSGARTPVGASGRGPAPAAGRAGGAAAPSMRGRGSYPGLEALGVKPHHCEWDVYGHSTVRRHSAPASPTNLAKVLLRKKSPKAKRRGHKRHKSENEATQVGENELSAGGSKDRSFLDLGSYVELKYKEKKSEYFDRFGQEVHDPKFAGKRLAIRPLISGSGKVFGSSVDGVVVVVDNPETDDATHTDGDTATTSSLQYKPNKEPVTESNKDASKETGAKSQKELTRIVRAYPNAPKFCHFCGLRYPLLSARFCCECGNKRLDIDGPA